MSWWTYITGVITVGTPARTSEQAEYIVKTVLNHLPQVTGSEGNMRVVIAPSTLHASSQNYDEFGKQSNNLVEGGLDICTEYLLTLEGQLRDRKLDQTKREFMKWLCRLAKRVGVDDLCVKISDYCGRDILIADPRPYDQMYELESPWVEKIEGPKWWLEFEEPNQYDQSGNQADITG